MFWDFPGGPVVRIPCFHCREHDWGTKILHATCHVAQPKKKRKGKKRDMVECSLDEAVNYIILLFNFIEEDLSKT